MTELGPLLHLKRIVEEQALVCAEQQGILLDERVTTNVDDFYYGKPQEYANHRCSFYLCHGCKKPYFGGLIDCEQEMAAAEQRETKKEDLLCQECLLKELGLGVRKCKEHGIDSIDWKCMYCCSIALYCCWGTNYFCRPCHDILNRVYPKSPPAKDCNGVNCPLGIPHPPAATTLDHKQGGAFPLGCSICRTEKYDELKKSSVKQVTLSSDQLPKSFISKRNRHQYTDIDDRDDRNPLIIRPLVEIWLPDFVAQADEILEREIAERLAAEKRELEARLAAEEAARILLNKTPVSFLGPRQLAKKARKERKRLQLAQERQ